MDIFKTPLAMELFINALYQTGGEATPVDRFWHGKVRPWFSLEIVSLGGKVGFFIWTRKELSGYIQSQIYAQYPGIEVKEVEDYTDKFDYSSGNYAMFGVEYALTEPDPVPIKTYVDYGLDKTSEEEEKTDPITAVLEFFGSLRDGENAWIQMIVRAHKKEDKDPESWFGKTDLWKDKAKDLIKEIREESLVEIDPEKGKMPMATEGQKNKITAIERSVSKLPFDVGIRAVYIAERDLFNGVNIPGLIGSFKQYGSLDLNGFKPGKTTSFDYWWQDPTGRRVAFLKNRMFKSYVNREYFFTGRKHFILNSEELATIFHFPGRVAITPGLERVQSRKGEAPANLPI